MVTGAWSTMASFDRNPQTPVPFLIPLLNHFDTKMDRQDLLTVNSAWGETPFERSLHGHNVLIARQSPPQSGCALMSRCTFEPKHFLCCVDPSHTQHFLTGCLSGFIGFNENSPLTPKDFYDIGLGAFVQLKNDIDLCNCAFVKSGDLTRQNSDQKICSNIMLIAVTFIEPGTVLTANPNLFNVESFQHKFFNQVHQNKKKRRIVLDDDDSDSDVENATGTQASLYPGSDQLVGSKSIRIVTTIGPETFVLDDPGTHPDAIDRGLYAPISDLALNVWQIPKKFPHTRDGSDLRRRVLTLQCYVDAVQITDNIDLWSSLLDFRKTSNLTTFFQDPTLPAHFPVPVPTTCCNATLNPNEHLTAMFHVDLSSTFLQNVFPLVAWSRFDEHILSVVMFPEPVLCERLVYSTPTIFVVLTGAVRFAWTTSKEWEGRILQETRYKPWHPIVSALHQRDFLFVRNARRGCATFVWPGSVLQCLVTEPNSSFLVLSPVSSSRPYAIDYLDGKGHFVPLDIVCDGSNSTAVETHFTVDSVRTGPTIPHPTSRQDEIRNKLKQTADLVLTGTQLLSCAY